MKSPFPGMDPFIEAVGLWRDFHDRLLSELERELSNRVSEQYFVRLAARTYLVPDEQLQGNHAPASGRTGGRAAKAKTRSTSKGDSPIQMLAPLDMEENEIF